MCETVEKPELHPDNACTHAVAVTPVEWIHGEVAKVETDPVHPWHRWLIFQARAEDWASMPDDTREVCGPDCTMQADDPIEIMITGNWVPAILRSRPEHVPAPGIWSKETKVPYPVSQFYAEVATGCGSGVLLVRLEPGLPMRMASKLWLDDATEETA